MSGLWVAVTAEFDGATFSHRAAGPDAPVAKAHALYHFDLLLDEASWCVRSGLAGWLPPQTGAPIESAPLPEHEKLRGIRKILDASSIGGQEIIDIYEVLNR